MQIYGKSEGFHFNSALFGSVSYNDPLVNFQMHRWPADLQTRPFATKESLEALFSHASLWTDAGLVGAVEKERGTGTRWWFQRFWIIFTPKFGEDFQNDEDFSDGLKPPTTIFAIARKTVWFHHSWNNEKSSSSVVLHRKIFHVCLPLEAWHIRAPNDWALEGMAGNKKMCQKSMLHERLATATSSSCYTAIRLFKALPLLKKTFGASGVIIIFGLDQLMEIQRNFVLDVTPTLFSRCDSSNAPPPCFCWLLTSKVRKRRSKLGMMRWRLDGLNGCHFSSTIILFIKVYKLGPAIECIENNGKRS